MIRSTVLGLVGCAIAIVVGASPTHAASTSPGKLAVYASTAAALIDDPTVILSATIQKGKKKRVLEVFASVILPPETLNEGGLLVVVPVVNGLTIMEPTQAGVTVAGSELCVNPDYPCHATGEFWLDLNAAEAAHPGQFIGAPIVIELQAEWRGVHVDAPVAATASLRARLEKK